MKTAASEHILAAMMGVEIMAIEDVDTAVKGNHEVGFARVGCGIDVRPGFADKSEEVWLFLVDALEKHFVVQSVKRHLGRERLERIKYIQRAVCGHHALRQGADPA